MDPNPNVYVAQEPTPSPESRFPKLPLIIMIVGVLIILGAIAIFSPKIISLFKTPTKTLPKLVSNNKNTPSKQKVQDLSSKATITTFRVEPNKVATYIDTKHTQLHLPPSLDNPPNEATSSSFIFKSEVISPDGQIYYTSWKSFPIVKKIKNSFEVKVLTPYQKGAILRLIDLKGKTILTTTF